MQRFHLFYIFFFKLTSKFGHRQRLFCHSDRFRDICSGKVDKGRITLMKDLSLMKTAAQGEYLFNKIQDFMWDEVLYEFISLPEVLG